MHFVDVLVFDDDADEIVFDVGDVRNFSVVDVHFDGEWIEFAVDPFVAFVRFWRVFATFVDCVGEWCFEQEAAFRDG